MGWANDGYNTPAYGNRPRRSCAAFIPEMPATSYCHTCRKRQFVETCKFTFPGRITLCAACTSKPQTGLSKKRKTLLDLGLRVGDLDNAGTSGLLFSWCFQRGPMPRPLASDLKFSSFFRHWSELR